MQNNPNTYYIALHPNMLSLALIPQPRIITFSTTTNLELPDPKYLKLHAAVCRVAHMSGAAGYLDLCDRDMEQTGRAAPVTMRIGYEG